MGFRFADQYSLLHFSTGVIAYFLGVEWSVWLGLHTLFEVVENSKWGISMINNHFKWFWPGGKETSDSLLNSVGDTVFTMLGWFCAKYLNQLGKKNSWH